VANSPQEGNGCGDCGDSVVQYVLETDIGVEAPTLAVATSSDPVFVPVIFSLKSSGSRGKRCEQA
jgi:hypothetical protein